MNRRISAVSLAASLLLMAGCDSSGPAAPTAATAPSLESARKASEVEQVTRKGAKGKVQGTQSPAVPD